VVEKLLAIKIGTPGQNRFLVKWKGVPDQGNTWEHEKELKCRAKCDKFIMKQFEKNKFPHPHNVHVIVGGPPCQGFSTGNRHRDEEDPYGDNNANMGVYLEAVRYFQPCFGVIENVVGLLEFCKSLVIETIIKELLLMDYQVRVSTGM
jgi:DNA (cytosine-5)-methyltransferase 1